MRILLDIGHPAHVHYFKNFIWAMEKQGHKIIVTARNKDVTQQLLNYYKIPFIDRGAGYKNLFGKAIGFIKVSWKLYCIARRYKVDLIIGGVGNAYTAFVGFLLHKPSIIFDDTEHSSIELTFIKRFATKIITPSCYKHNLGKKQIRYNGFHELAYLHPNYFKPNPYVLKELDLKKGEKFFILRFVAWEASHDTGSKGVSFKAKKEIINLLEKEGKVFISSESELEPCLKKYKIPLDPSKFHSLLYYAELYVGDGSTPAVESALLGTPALHFEAYKSKNGKITDVSKLFGNIQELQEADLMQTFCDEQKMINYIKRILKIPDFKRKIVSKRLKTLLNKKIDVTKFMVELVEKEFGRKND